MQHVYKSNQERTTGRQPPPPVAPSSQLPAAMYSHPEGYPYQQSSRKGENRKLLPPLQRELSRCTTTPVRCSGI